MSPINISKRNSIALLLLVAISQAAMAADPQQKGLEIARAARAYD